MAYLLHIESTSTVCSVALSEDLNIIASRSENNGYSHAEKLHVFIRDIMQESGLSLQQLNAVAVSSGPGSYTGLRIGFSSAKGLAYALQIPLIVVDSLKALAYKAKQNMPGKDAYCPMVDARRMEVYTALYKENLTELKAPNALVLSGETTSFFETGLSLCCFGDGMPKAKDLLSNIKNISFLDNMMPDAESLVSLAVEKYNSGMFSDVAYAEPMYLKDFFFTASKK